jgi:hypothetical protein
MPLFYSSFDSKQSPFHAGFEPFWPEIRLTGLLRRSGQRPTRP